MYFDERKRSKISEFNEPVCKSSARSNHRTTLPQSRPLGVTAPSEREPGGVRTIQRTARKPQRCGRFSSPLRKAIHPPSVDKSVESVNNSGENRGKGCGEWAPHSFWGPETQKNPVRKALDFWHGDPYGNRTHVTAVKGRCLNRLTNGPGSGNLIRTDDIPGMNRLLYQLSYAAMCGQMISAPPKSASLLYPLISHLSRKIFDFFGAARCTVKCKNF